MLIEHGVDSSEFSADVSLLSIVIVFDLLDLATIDEGGALS